MPVMGVGAGSVWWLDGRNMISIFVWEFTSILVSVWLGGCFQIKIRNTETVVYVEVGILTKIEVKIGSERTFGIMQSEQLNNQF